MGTWISKVSIYGSHSQGQNTFHNIYFKDFLNWIRAMICGVGATVLSNQQRHQRTSHLITGLVNMQNIPVRSITIVGLILVFWTSKNTMNLMKMSAENFSMQNKKWLLMKHLLLSYKLLCEFFLCPHSLLKKLKGLHVLLLVKVEPDAQELLCIIKWIK